MTGSYVHNLQILSTRTEDRLSLSRNLVGDFSFDGCPCLCPRVGVGLRPGRRVSRGGGARDCLRYR